MRTRSKVSSETIDHAACNKKKDAEKRKRKDDDSAVGNAGDRNKRRKIQVCAEVAIASQSLASQVKSPPKRKHHSSADPGKAAEVLFAKNGDDEVFAMTLEKFVGALQKRGAADNRSSPNATGNKSSDSLKKAIGKKHGMKESPGLIQPRKQGQSCDHTHTLDHHVRDNEKSTEGVAIEQCSSRNKSLVKRQRGIDGQENLTSTHYDEDGLQIVGTPLSPQEPAGVHCQSHEDGHHSEPDATLSQGKIEKSLHSRHKKKGASLGGCLQESLQGEQNRSHTTLPERMLEELPLSSGKNKCRSGNIKQFNNQRKENIGSAPTQVSQRPNSCYSRKRLNDAKSRWKNLAWSILSAKISPEILTSASKDLVERHIFSSESVFVKDHSHRLTDLPDVGEQTPKKRRKPFAAANALAADQRPVPGRMGQKVHKQQLSLMKRMKTCLSEANFSQSAKEKNSNDVGEEFIVTEDERHAFAKNMVKSCQKNSNMRTVFLESVRMLTLSGLMQAAASNLLQQGPCEEAQNVMNAWADFKEQSPITKTLPMNLLNAVNQLHEKRGDLSTKLSTPNVVGICTLSQIDEQTWKFQVPGSP